MRMPCPLYHCFPLVRSPPCRPNFPPRSALTHERTAQAAEAVQHCECDLVCTETKKEILPFSPPQSHPDKRSPHPTKNVASFLEQWKPSLSPSRNLHTTPAAAAMLNLLCKSEPQRGILSCLACRSRMPPLLLILRAPERYLFVELPLSTWRRRPAIVEYIVGECAELRREN